MKTALLLTAAAGLLALSGLHKTPNPPGPSPDGTMPEVVVTAEGPRMVTDEVVIQADRSAIMAENALERLNAN